MPYINVDEVYILDNTGLQVDQTTDIPFADAGFTDTQKAQARKNIAAGGTNPNLLDNPWWGSGEVVNQRAATSGTPTTNQFTIDRWKFNVSGSGGNYSLGATGFELTAGTGRLLIRQVFANVDPLDGKTITASVLHSDGTITSGTITRANGTEQYIIGSSSDVLYAYFGTNDIFNIGISAENTVTIRAVKLELGTVSTLANDTPPNYAEELAKCKYYFERIYPTTGNYSVIGIGIATAATTASVLVSMATKRDVSLTVSSSGSFRLLQGSTGIAATSISKQGSQANNGMFLSVAVSSGLTTGNAVLFGAQNNSTCYLDISADL